MEDISTPLPFNLFSKDIEEVFDKSLMVVQYGRIFNQLQYLKQINRSISNLAYIAKIY